MIGNESFLDENISYAKAFLENDYEYLNKKIDSLSLTYKKEIDGSLYGFVISKNEPLTKLYGFQFNVVRFVFKNFCSLHNNEQEKIIKEMCIDLKNKVDDTKGYYNIRIPSHIIDLVKGFNEIFKNYQLCGCTTEQGTCKETIVKNDPELKIFYADKEYLIKNEENLKELMFKSFENYKGQYHISSITCSKAGQIYSNWINESLLKNDRVIIGEINNKIAGCITVRDVNDGVEAFLGCVNSEYQRRGIYKSLISALINDSHKERKVFVSGTQIENYRVLKAWASMGLRPLYSFYNIHYCNI